MAPSSSNGGPSIGSLHVKGAFSVSTSRPTVRTPSAHPYTSSKSRKSSAVPPALKAGNIKGAPKHTGVKLNPSDHPRSDPIGALGTLLKLLTALPSRIGGCQYKFTPAEHALAVHLVGVLDPFVCHGARALSSSDSSGVAIPGSASALSITSLPTELIDLILSNVDSRKDLLHVGLVSKRLSDIVFPRHFEYRVIRCKVSSVKVWKHLISHGALARNVRKVEIMDERERARRVIVPRVLRAKAVAGRDGGVDTASATSSSSDEQEAKKFDIHVKHERILTRALLCMTHLKVFKWSCNHSPISVSSIWSSLMAGPGNGLEVLDVSDNMAFHPGLSWKAGGESDSEESEPESEEQDPTRSKGIILSNMTSAVFKSTSHAYGAAKNPELGRITKMLHQCVNLKNLEISYVAPRSSVATSTGGLQPNGNPNPSRTRPLADQLLSYTRFVSSAPETTTLTTLSLNNIRLTTPHPLVQFLSVHHAIEHLSLTDVHLGASNQTHGWLQLPPGSLPKLKEVKACKEIINAVLECPLSVAEADEEMADGNRDANGMEVAHGTRRPLTNVNGFKLSGHDGHRAGTPGRSVPDPIFLANLKNSSHRVRHIELASWHELDDIRKLALASPNLEYLNVGRRIGAHPSSSSSATVVNITEWTDVVSTLPELKELRGVKFFYEVSNPPTSFLANVASHLPSTSNSTSTIDTTPQARSLSPYPPLPSHIHLSATDRSRMRKNEEVAGILAWKCKSLRKVDWWDDDRVVVLLRDGECSTKARWEIRKVSFV